MLILSVVALAVALTMQYGFGFKPCTFCLYIRYPYVILLIMNSLWLLWGFPLKSQLVLNALIVGSNFVLSVALVLIEKGIIHMRCRAVQYSGQESASELLRTLTNHQSCAKVTVSFWGWSMAMWHSLFAGAVLILCIVGWIYAQKGQSDS
jgi:disulfide bond formation protein DsbB